MSPRTRTTVRSIRRMAGLRNSALEMLRKDYDRQVAENARLRAMIKGIHRITKELDTQ